MTDNLVYIANAGAADYGITVAALDYDRGALEVVQQVTEISECHYLNLHPSGKLLLATTMDGAVEVVSFAIDAEGKLRKVSSAPAAGTSPAYVCADASGKCALLVNYVNAGARGNIRVYPLDGDGNLGEVCEHIEIDDETGPNQERQDVSHPHMIVTTPRQSLRRRAGFGHGQDLSLRARCRAGQAVSLAGAGPACGRGAAACGLPSDAAADVRHQRARLDDGHVVL